MLFAVLNCTLFNIQLHKAPLAVHEFLDLGIVSGDAKRGDFFQDEQIKPEKFAVNQNYYKDTSAYRHFRYTRGHMAAAGNYSGNQEMKLSTVFFQLSSFLMLIQYLSMKATMQEFGTLSNDTPVFFWNKTNVTPWS